MKTHPINVKHETRRAASARLNATTFTLGKEYIMNRYSETENLKKEYTTVLYYPIFFLAAQLERIWSLK